MPFPARRWVLWPLAMLAALLLVAAIAATWLVTTESGLRHAVTLVESLGSVRIRVTGASGRLIGPLAIGSVEIEHPRASIRISGLSADYEPLEILAGRISAEGARIRDVAVTLREAAGPKKPPSFMPGWLTVAIDDASVDHLLVISPNGAETHFRDLHGSARIARTTLRFDGVGARSTGWAVAGASGTLFARDPIAMDVTTAWSVSEDNLVGGVARAIGDLDRMAVDARIAAPGKGRIKAEVRDLAKELSFRGQAEIESLDLAQWVDEPPVGPLSGKLEIEGGRLDYAVRGRLRGRGLPREGVALDARTRWAKPALRIESLRLVAAPGLDLRAAGINTIVWATGHRRSYPWLRPLPVLDTQGEIRQYRGRTPMPGLYVLGQRFQHRRSSHLIGGVGRDASEVAEHIVGRHRAANSGPNSGDDTWVRATAATSAMTW